MVYKLKQTSSMFRSSYHIGIIGSPHEIKYRLLRVHIMSHKIIGHPLNNLRGRCRNFQDKLSNCRVKNPNNTIRKSEYKRKFITQQICNNSNHSRKACSINTISAFRSQISLQVFMRNLFLFLQYLLIDWGFFYVAQKLIKANDSQNINHRDVINLKSCKESHNRGHDSQDHNLSSSQKRIMLLVFNGHFATSNNINYIKQERKIKVDGFIA